METMNPKFRLHHIVVFFLLFSTLSASDAVSGDREFIYSEITPSGNLNPYQQAVARATNERLYSLIYQPLFRYDFFEQTFHRVLAQDVELSGDNKRITLHLRRGVQWHDGTPFTAVDVEFTIRYIMQSDEGIRNRNLYNSIIQNIRVVNDRLLVINLSEPYHGIYFEGFFPNWIIPAHLFNDDFSPVADKDISRRPVGTGPYMFDQRTIEGSVSLRRFEDYWGDKPLIERIRMELSSDLGTMIMRLQARISSLVIDVPADRIPQVETLHHRILPYQSYMIQTIGFNFRNERLSDQKIRQAIVYGTDRNNMLQQWYGGRGELLAGPFTSEAPFFDVNLEPYPYDPDRARELIQEAGYRLDSRSGYFVDSDGNHLSFNFVVPVVFDGGDSPLQNIVADFRENMRNIGIEVIIRNRTRDDYEVTLFREHDFDLIFVEWEFSPEYNISHLFHSNHIRPNGLNIGAYQNVHVDNLLNAFQEARDPATKMGHMRNVQNILRNDVPYVFLLSAHKNAAIDYRYVGVRIDPFYFFTYINQWQVVDGF